MEKIYEEERERFEESKDFREYSYKIVEKVSGGKSDARDAYHVLKSDKMI